MGVWAVQPGCRAGRARKGAALGSLYSGQALQLLVYAYLFCCREIGIFVYGQVLMKFKLCMETCMYIYIYIYTYIYIYIYRVRFL